MTQDEIIRFAIQCRLVTTGNRDGLYMDALTEFANLVAAKEREALAQTQEPLKIFQYNCTCGRTMKFESVHGVVAPQRTEQNFCSRCGKRVGGIDSIHTCTPPMEMNT